MSFSVIGKILPYLNMLMACLLFPDKRMQIVLLILSALEILFSGLTMVIYYCTLKRTRNYVAGIKKVYVSYKQFIIKGTNVEQVSNFKYLRIIIDNFTFQGNVEHIHKKARQCLGILQKKSNFNIDRKTLIWSIDQ